MRTIKFRAWDGKKMALMHEINPLDLYAILTTEPTKKCFLMQFTGLLDTDGHEIYEGDVVKRRRPLYKSDSPAPNGSVIDTFEIEWVTWPRNGFNLVSSRYCKILGNVYENPELLEQL